MVRVVVSKTSRSAIAGKPRCSVCEPWQKYKCKKRASNDLSNSAFGERKPPPRRIRSSDRDSDDLQNL